MAQAVRALTCGSTEKPTNDDSAEVSLRCANGPTAPAPASGSPLEAAGAGAALAAPTMLRPRPPRVPRVPPGRESAGEVRREARGAWRGVAISPTSAITEVCHTATPTPYKRKMPTHAPPPGEVHESGSADGASGGSAASGKGGEGGRPRSPPSLAAGGGVGGSGGGGSAAQAEPAIAAAAANATAPAARARARPEGWARAM
mmetsp:Transcript_26546/g.83136  ORF Transcript_26546/g.83136 Transcript_26546/m.83136 type:complete len:202 (+) Transcript_26546:257-862(+)